MSLRDELLARVQNDPTDVFTPDEVGVLFRCDPRTVTRWATKGQLRCAYRTPGGHRRYEARDLAPHFGITYGGEA